MSETAPSSLPEAPLTPLIPRKGSNEVFLGGMIIAVLCLILLILAGTFGYFGYRLWQTSHIERTTPSIQELGEKMGGTERVAPSTPETPSTSTPIPTTPSTVVVPDKATLEVKILNGGGAKGSASTLTELLKKAGYTKAAFGNAVSDYTGTTVYYGTDGLKAAELLKAEVMKTYPKVTLAPAKAGDKDTTAATLVVILGKE